MPSVVPARSQADSGVIVFVPARAAKKSGAPAMTGIESNCPTIEPVSAKGGILSETEKSRELHSSLFAKKSSNIFNCVGSQYAF